MQIQIQMSFSIGTGFIQPLPQLSPDLEMPGRLLWAAAGCRPATTAVLHPMCLMTVVMIRPLYLISLLVVLSTMTL